MRCSVRIYRPMIRAGIRGARAALLALGMLLGSRHAMATVSVDVSTPHSAFVSGSTLFTMGASSAAPSTDNLYHAPAITFAAGNPVALDVLGFGATIKVADQMTGLPGATSGLGTLQNHYYYAYASASDISFPTCNIWTGGMEVAVNLHIKSDIGLDENSWMPTIYSCFDTTNTCSPTAGTSGISNDSGVVNYSDLYLRIGGADTHTDAAPDVELAQEDSSIVKVCHVHYDGNSTCTVVSCDN